MISEMRTTVVQIDEILHESKNWNRTRVIVFRAHTLNGRREELTLKCFVHKGKECPITYRLRPGIIAKVTILETRECTKVIRFYDNVRTQNTLTHAYETFRLMCRSARIDLSDEKKEEMALFFEDHRNLRHTDLVIAERFAYELGRAFREKGCDSADIPLQNTAHLFGHLSGIVLTEGECASVLDTFVKSCLA